MSSDRADAPMPRSDVVAASAPAPISEGRLTFLLGAVQFVNVVDFVMVLPLGPDFASALNIPTHQLGLVAGSYTASAAIAGLVAATFLDRFDRRRALVVAMLGLVLGTATGGAALGLGSMLLARVLAGAFGGPASSLSLSILTDVVPPERRGRAIGKVMGAFSIASVLGVPAGLELARLGGWQLPFFVIAGLGAMVTLAAGALLPPMREHLRVDAGAPRRAPLVVFLADRAVPLSLAGTAVAMVGSFSIISNLSSFVQFNLGYPRAELGVLYMAGGCVSFFSMRLAGWSADRWGAPAVVGAGTALVITVIALAFLPVRPLIPVVGMVRRLHARELDAPRWLQRAHDTCATSRRAGSLHVVAICGAAPVDERRRRALDRRAPRTSGSEPRRHGEPGDLCDRCVGRPARDCIAAGATLATAACALLER